MPIFYLDVAKFRRASGFGFGIEIPHQDLDDSCPSLPMVVFEKYDGEITRVTEQSSSTCSNEYALASIEEARRNFIKHYRYIGLECPEQDETTMSIIGLTEFGNFKELAEANIKRQRAWESGFRALAGKIEEEFLNGLKNEQTK